MTPELQRDLESWALEAAEAHGVELYDVTVATSGRWIVRVFIDRPGGTEPGQGVSIDECSDVSRYLEAYFDADARMPDNYLLEVSSPGIERPLKNERHVAQVVGKLVDLTVREPIEGQNKVVGQLLSFEEGILEIRVSERESVLTVPWSAVSKARLKYDFSGVKDQ